MIAKLSLSKIRLDGGTQSRAVINDNVVAEYAEKYAEDSKHEIVEHPMPPVTVFLGSVGLLAGRWVSESGGVGVARFQSSRRPGDQRHSPRCDSLLGGSQCLARATPYQCR